MNTAITQQNDYHQESRILGVILIKPLVFGTNRNRDDTDDRSLLPFRELQKAPEGRDWNKINLRMNEMRTESLVTTWTISEVLDADAMVEVPEGLEEPENVEIVFIKAHSHSVMDVSSSYDKSRWRQNVSILLSCSHLTLCVTIEKLWIKIV